MDPLVITDERRDYAVIRLNRPAKRNAMNRAARRDLLNAFEVVRGRFKVVILTGTSDSFCSGVDLKEAFGDLQNGRSDDASSDWMEVNLAVRSHPAIFIAAVNGVALGGGATLINVCDLAFAANEAEIGLPELGFSAYPQLAGPATQIQLSRKRAAWLVLTGMRINGSTAEQWGMVNRSVPRAQLQADVEKLAHQIAQYDAAALSETKRALDVIPAQIANWRPAFEYGVDVNTRIRSQSGAQRTGLETFASRTQANQDEL
jgi:enoyl-CoA hydratase/carnithine racemase